MNLFGSNSSFLTDNIYKIALLLLLAWAAVMFTVPVGEGDLFWHVKTGEWIWQHWTLPDSDPFSFTVKDINPYNPDSKRIPFILKQYWLAQLALFGIWKVAGVPGIVLFRSLCYTGILLFLYRIAGGGRRIFVPFLAIAAVANVLRNYPNERPQIFAFILLPVLIFLLDKILTLRDFRRSPGIIAALLLVMLIWSNCHGSFMLGIVITTLYAIGHLIDCSRGRDSINKVLLLSLLSAVLVTTINPNGYTGFKVFFARINDYSSMATEFTPPLVLALQYHAIDYYYWLLLIISVATILSSLKRISAPHFLVIAALLGLSLTGTRYIPFFVIATPLLCTYIPEWKPGNAARYLPLIVLAALVITADYSNVLKFRSERSFPEKASMFLNRVQPHGNMFNFISWGGYLMCYGSNPVFIDGRILVEEVLSHHNLVMSGFKWQTILQNYDINFIIIPGTESISLKPYPFLLQLLGDNAWQLIYQDEVALVLIRNTPENSAIIKANNLDKNRMASHIQERWQWQMKNEF